MAKKRFISRHNSITRGDSNFIFSMNIKVPDFYNASIERLMKEFFFIASDIYRKSFYGGLKIGRHSTGEIGREEGL